MNRSRIRRLSPVLFLGALIGGAGITLAAAQFGPPSTMFGSITDAGKTVESGLVVEAYVGETLCGKNETRFTGDGSARVTVYSVHVVSREQTAGCGFEGADVRIKVGDRFAEQTAKWTPGPVELNLTFGGATPAPIPTFTPSPTTEGGANASGTPGAGGTSSRGGVTSTSPSASSSAVEGDDDGGFPIWVTVALVVVALGLVGGGAGYALSRNRGSAGEA
jgi:hypothetical protein